MLSLARIRRLHLDGGMLNIDYTSHVVVIVQALLHTWPLLELIVNDEDHRRQCKSASCIMCLLHEAYREMGENGVADPTPLCERWKGISLRMTAEKQKSTVYVISILLDVLRMEFSMRNPKCTVQDVLSSSIGKMWQIVSKAKVSCSTCGAFSHTTFSNVIELTAESVCNLESSTVQHLIIDKEQVCPRCQQNNAKVTVTDVDLPDCMVIHVDRCSSEFNLAFELSLLERQYALKCIIVEPFDRMKRNCCVVTCCPDMHWRKFEGTKISSISPISHPMTTMLLQSKLTFIYVIPPKVPHQIVNNNVQEQGSLGKMKSTSQVQSYHKLSELKLSEEAPPSEELQFEEVENTRHIATQISVTVSDVEIQTLPYYCYEICRQNRKFKLFTGLEQEDFRLLFELIGGDNIISHLKRNYVALTPQKIVAGKLTSEDKLFMFLLRLRRGLPLQELSEMFQVSVGLVGEVCYAMTRLIYLTFKAMENDMFPTAAQQRKNKPLKMKAFKNLRIILDGASFYVQTPSNFQQQGNMHSSYKSHAVMVFSIGISCNGATIYCSGGMEGSMSDKGVILASGLLDRLQRGDGVMTDRGYELQAELQAKGCEFYKPPSLGKRDCFTKEEEILTKAIATSRIYTEHAIADIKDNRLLQGVIPLTMLPVLGNLVYIAAYLRNFSSSTIQDKRFVSCTGKASTATSIP